MVFAGAFLAVLFAVALTGKLSWFVVAGYLAASAVTFALYAMDKSAARRREWRIKERTLHLFGLAGGWPGALMAQRLLHHKTNKRSFQHVFRGSVLLHCVVLSMYLRPGMLRALISFLKQML